MNRLVLFNNTDTVDSGSAGVTNPNQVPDQEIAIFDVDDQGSGTLDLTGANATQRMIIVQGDDKDPFVTQIIDKSQIKRVTRKDFTPYVNQVTNVGFSGSGSAGLEVEPGDQYLKLTRLDKGFEQFPRATADITVFASDTEYDIAKKLAHQINSFGGSKSFVTADILVNGDSTATTETYMVENGSVEVEGSASPTVAADDYLRLGGDGLDNPVYRVESVDGNFVTLDRPYTGASASGVAGSELDAAVTDEEGGLQITGKDITEVSDFVESEAAVSFETALSPGFGATTVSVAETPQTGSGQYEQMREEERQAAGMQHSFLYRNYFPQTPEYYAQEDVNYDVITIIVELDNDNAVVNQNRYLEVVLAYNEDAEIADQIAAFFGV